MKNYNLTLKVIILSILFLNAIYSIYVLLSENCVDYGYCKINYFRILYLCSNILIFYLTFLFFSREKKDKEDKNAILNSINNYKKTIIIFFTLVICLVILILIKIFNW